jgi:serine/threonine-protein kinase
MSRVFLSEDIGTGGRKAIKAISFGYNQSQGQGPGQENISLRAYSEIEMLKRLSHPGLPKAEEVIENQDGILIVMDYIPGRSLQNLLIEYGAQPKASVLGWMLSAMRYPRLHAHEKPSGHLPGCQAVKHHACARRPDHAD